MSRRRSISFILLLIVFSVSGCAMATVKYRPLGDMEDHVALPLGSTSKKRAEGVDAFLAGERPPAPVIVMGEMASGGNGYAKNSTLIRRLKEATKKSGGNVVYNISFGATRSTDAWVYGSGLALPVNINRPHAFGVYGLYSPVQMGVNLEEGMRVIVVDNPDCEFCVGDRFIEVDGRRVLGGPLDYLKALNYVYSHRSPGEEIIVKVVDKDDNPCDRRVKLMATRYSTVHTEITDETRIPTSDALGLLHKQAKKDGLYDTHKDVQISIMSWEEADNGWIARVRVRGVSKKTNELKQNTGDVLFRQAGSKWVVGKMK